MKMDTPARARARTHTQKLAIGNHSKKKKEEALVMYV